MGIDEVEEVLVGYAEKLSLQRRIQVGPIKFRSDAASIVIEDDLCASLIDDHAFSSKLAIIFVESNVTDM